MLTSQKAVDAEKIKGRQKHSSLKLKCGATSQAQAQCLALSMNFQVPKNKLN